LSLLAFDSVGCVRGGRPLFEHVSFALEAGGAVLVTGPNGVGKSSLIRIGAGLLRPASGQVTVGAARALLTEQASLDEEKPLAAALLFWARFDRADAAKAVQEALAVLGLDALTDIPVRLLSTGQRRRATFARVMASGSPVWLLDEPANGLDVEAVARLEDAVARHRDAGGAVLMASHTEIALPGALRLPLSHSGESQDPVATQSPLDPGLRQGGNV